jgi:competence protein ComEC
MVRQAHHERRGGILKGGFIATIMLLLAGSIAHQHGLFSKDQLEVTFLDVGQGSSIFVRLPDRQTILIDGGGFAGSDFDVGKYVIAPFLWRKGVNKIDTVVLTHAHPDHYKGLAYIVKNFSPSEFLWNGIPPTGQKELFEWDEFVDEVSLSKFSLPLWEGVRGRGEGVLNFFVPKSNGSTPDLNDTSVVTLIKYKDASVLLTGDISESKEGEVLNWLSQTTNCSSDLHVGSNLGITILQVPHHGSKNSTSETFLKALKPEFAVIQAGQRNRYGFPNREVVKRLEESKIKVLRTDRDGAVTFKTDGAHPFILSLLASLKLRRSGSKDE